MRIVLLVYILLAANLVSAQDSTHYKEKPCPLKPPEVSGIEINNTGDKGELELIGSFLYDRETPGAELEVEYAPARWLSLEAELPVYFEKPFLLGMELAFTFSVLQEKEKGLFLCSGLDFEVPFINDGEFELEPWLGFKKTFSFIALLSKLSFELDLENKEELEYGIKAAFGPYFQIIDKVLIGSPLNFHYKEKQNSLLSGLECDIYFTEELTLRLLGQYYVISEEKGPFICVAFKVEFE